MYDCNSGITTRNQRHTDLAFSGNRGIYLQTRSQKKRIELINSVLENTKFSAEYVGAISKTTGN